jgi:uncharacterized protein YjbI with pentapeptide repeats
MQKASLEGADLSGAKLQQADLRGAPLQGVSLYKAQLQGANLERADLRGAQLQGANLEGANLSGAQLQQADLRGAPLQGANLEGANLSGAQLQEPNLEGADLSGAQLQRANLSHTQLQQARLIEAQLQGASFIDAQLQGANLDEAQLQGANLRQAQLRGACVIGVNFERLPIPKDGEPGQERSTDLTDADFRAADLSNAQLSTVTGLRAERLGGAVLTNAKLPNDVGRFDALKHVEETSRNASTVFFGLLAASLYSWLTIATTTDVALITGTASSPLPIINTNIALSGFYLAAPLILIAVYVYFHLYLQRLWGCLASLPAVFPDGEALDDKAYPWLLNSLVRVHFKKLAHRPRTRWEKYLSILLAWWVVPVTLVFFWLRFLPRHDWPVTWLHVVLIAIAAWFGVDSYRLAVRTLRGEKLNRGDQPRPVRIWRTVRRNLTAGMAAAGFGAGIVVALSVDTAIEPGDDLLTALGSGLGYETYAELTDDDISTKPSGWTGQDETAEVEIAQVKAADLERRDLRNADAHRAFLVKADLSSADLRSADLSRADLKFADLSRADLSGADLSGAILIRADLSRADLSGAILNGAHLNGAQLSHADLSSAHLSGAQLDRVYLSGADLRNAFFLTQGQLDTACGDDKTQLPEGLTIRPCPDTAPSASPSPLPGSS